MKPEVNSLHSSEFSISTDTSKKTLHRSGSQDSLDSENSYGPLVEPEEVFEDFTFLLYNSTWSFFAGVANIMLYFIYTYDLLFDSLFQLSQMVYVVVVACDLIVIIDIASSICHHALQKYAVKKSLKPRPKAVIAFDAFSVVWLGIMLSPTLRKIQTISIIGVTLLGVRLYRVIWYCILVSNSADSNHVIELVNKYGLILIVLFHTTTCIWQSLGCYLCEERNWTISIEDNLYLGDVTPLKMYITALYFSVQGFSCLGIGDVYASGTAERILATASMLVGFILMEGVFIGEWTSVQVENYRRFSIFLHRFSLIRKSLNHPRVSKQLAAKIVDYYCTFWYQQGAIGQPLSLFYFVPSTFIQQAYLDKFWHALNKSTLFTDVNPAFLRAIAGTLQTDIYTPGEIVYTAGEEKHKMVYIVKGNLQILSSEDNESPVLTLGMGSCLGETSLFYSHPNYVQVIASSYCIVHTLNKTGLWRMAVKYNKLKPTEKLMKIMKSKMQNAYDVFEVKKINLLAAETCGPVSKTLKLVKRTLRTEEIIVSSIINLRSAWQTDESLWKSYKTSDLYILSKHQTTLKHSDEIFLHTSWPWILQAHSVFITIWEYFICFLITVVLILYPYFISYAREFNLFNNIALFLVDICYFFDIIIQIFTAVEDENGTVSDIKTIVEIRFRNLSFILDVISIMPLNYVAYIFDVTRNSRIIIILIVNRMFKVHRVINLLRDLGTSFYINMAVVRCFKYTLYLLFVAYFMGSMYYMMACFVEECKVPSWHSRVSDEDLASNGTRHNNSFLFAVYYGMLITTKAAGELKVYTVPEISVISIFMVIGLFLYCYMVSDFAATLMLNKRSKNMYIEMVTITRQFLKANNMLLSVQHRMDNYLTLQWHLNHGYVIANGKSILHDLPQHMQAELNEARYMDIIALIPAFTKLPKELLQQIGAEIQLLYLPPNEVIVYAGDNINSMYVIELGFCKMSAATGQDEKVLGPMAHFCVFEMFFEQSTTYYVRTVTHVRILKISHHHVTTVMMKYPKIQKQFRKAIEVLSESNAIKRLFTKTSNVIYQDEEPHTAGSWFVYPTRKLHPLKRDYDQGFKKMDMGRIFRFIMLRRTLLPTSNFLVYWEIGRAICAFLTGMLYPTIFVYRHYVSDIDYYYIILEVMAWLDMYVRLHVCYYNDKGILVSHPKKTALHYLTGAFIIDFLGVLRMGQIISLMISTNWEIQDDVSSHHKMKTIVTLNTIIQIYRIPDAFSYFSLDILKPTGVFIMMVKFVPISLVLLNFLTMIMLAVTCEFVDADLNQVLAPSPGSWINHVEDSFYFNKEEPFHLYILTYYWISTLGLSTAFGDIGSQTVVEVIMNMFILILGYLVFTYMVVTISSRKLNINIYLTLYQEHTKHLITFMRKEKIHRDIQRATINHFEYIWQRTHGIKSSLLLQNCHLPLREDAVFYLYEQTLVQVPVFIGVSRPFYRSLGKHLEERYFLRNSSIIRLNDIISTVYIIHKGEAKVLGPDGSVFAVLTRGCMFGNIDNTKSTRSMISVVASQSVDLLCINTERMYQLAETYSTVTEHLHRHLLLENLSYVDKPTAGKDNENVNTLETGKTVSPTSRRTLRFMFSDTMQMIMMVFSFLSCMTVSYHSAFQDHSHMVFAATYLLDGIHVYKFIAEFFTPYLSDMGELITDRTKIRIRYMRLSKCYIELFALLPFEIFSFLAPATQHLFYLSWLRMNRMLRAWNIYLFYNIKLDRLNINMLAIKLGSIMIFFMLMTHIGACLLFIVGCDGGGDVCPDKSWINIEKHGMLLCDPDQFYICSIYFMVTMTTCSGVGDFSPKTISDCILCIFLMLACKFIQAFFIGDMSAVIQDHTYTLTNYDNTLNKLKEYLKLSYLSKPLAERLLNYTYRLWYRDRGIQQPALIDEAPSCLLEDIKLSAYGKHFSENYIFVSCHNDFLRLLCAKLRPITLFAGDTICEQGDVNDTMYFIHEGIVDVYALGHNQESKVDQLRELDCFGMIQGLFADTPHTHTFKAKTVLVLLTLQLNDWVHLLKFFPAARYEIYERIENI